MITIIMAMTIATIGRLIKNFDMLLCRSLVPILRNLLLWRYRSAVLRFDEPFRHDRVAR